MPAVNPSHQLQGNVTLDQAPAAQLGLIIKLSVAAAGLAILVALRLARRSRGEKHYRLLGSLASPSAPGQQHEPFRAEAKSRGVSSSVHETTMASDPESTVLPFRGEGELEKRDDVKDVSHEESMRSARAVGISLPRGLLSRPPLPPPLTPPKWASGAFAFEDRRLSAAVSTMGELDATFFQQPNPDYTSGSDGSSFTTSSAPPLIHDSSPTSRRRSYTKALPLGPPQPVSTLELDGSITPFSPSSFPSSSPILPLAPHESFTSKEIDVHGEILSVLDDSGAGWKRHTRVYGGGVCLACMASSEGGFYGDKVRPEERR